MRGPSRVGLILLLALGLVTAVLVPADPDPASAAPVQVVYTYDVQGLGNTSDLEAFAAEAGATLADPRGWTLGGPIQFVRVPSGGSFTLWLSAPGLVPSFGPPCDSTWSCSSGRNVIINEARWLGASSAWVGGGGSLTDYRRMVVNHEVGHWLGFGHVSCPAAGQPAPVMQQQSISLQGCVPNPWPLPSERQAVADARGVSVFTGSPVGAVERVAANLNTIEISGWVVDPDSNLPTDAHVYVDGVGPFVTTASASRPDLVGAYPAQGGRYGFALTIPASSGVHTVCAYGIDRVPPGSPSPLGCTAVEVGVPFGFVDELRAGPGTIAIRGWALDPDTAGPIAVHVYVDGAAAAVLTAGDLRPDVGAAYPGRGDGHGFAATLPVTGGDHVVCAYGINTPGGSNGLLGCRGVRVGGSPVGFVDEVAPGLQRVHVRGWTIDPDVATPIGAHLYVDGIGVAAITANADRPDLGLVLPEYGPAHGVDATLTVTGGVHQLCAYGINTGWGGNALLGCRWVTVGGPPVGWLDSVTATPGTVHVQGWALDPDTAASIPVHAYLDGTGVAVLTADGNRPDLAAALPDYGPAHGIDATIPVPAGTTHQLCLYGINTAYGTNALLGCRTVTA